MTELPGETPMTVHTAPEQTPGPPRRGVRLRTAALFGAAVLAAGAAGGVATGAVLQGGTATAVPAAVARTTATVTAASSTVGDPESAAAAIAPSVVTLEVTGTQTGGGYFGAPQTRSVADTGSGIVIRADGYILTNNHVVSAANGGATNGGGTVTVAFSNGSTARATVVGQDPTSDLAVVKVGGARGLTAATFADSDQVRVGQAVLAVGAPLGLSNTVTEGIVSTLHRPVTTGVRGAGDQAVIDAIQTDAAINPGNSGGALVDLAGHVVGINSAIATTGGASAGNIGVGFAIPSNDAAHVADQLIATGHATHAQLGVSVGDTGGSGATVRAVTGGGPAQRAGLRAGDVITKIGDRRVTDADSLVVAIRAHDPGTTVTVAYTRGGQAGTAQVTLTAAPAA
ncbi:MAG TPA: trypsin-like peptidase domain-containing protein [Mycobacteriales bacterium]|nr:trypsin-like peptidase domain-containing protein [Mycobacteriales bacterium]